MGAGLGRALGNSWHFSAFVSGGWTEREGCRVALSLLPAPAEKGLRWQNWDPFYPFLSQLPRKKPTNLVFFWGRHSSQGNSEVSLPSILITLTPSDCYRKALFRSSPYIPGGSMPSVFCLVSLYNCRLMGVPWLLFWHDATLLPFTVRCSLLSHSSGHNSNHWGSEQILI